MENVDTVGVIILSLAKDNPAEVHRIKKACTYMDIAMAWANNRRTTEGVGYRIDYGK